MINFFSNFSSVTRSQAITRAKNKNVKNFIGEDISKLLQREKLSNKKDFNGD